MPVQLSVNVNKVATLRNSRGGEVPSLTAAIGVAIDAGAQGITIHPRHDERHITGRDVLDVARYLESQRDQVEFNIEGDPRPELMDVVCEVQPHQCTLVPVRPGEVTSEAGWDPTGPNDYLADVISRLRSSGVRVSVFVDPKPEPIRWARRMGADRIELYTEPFARAFATGGEQAERSMAEYAESAELAHALGMGVNAGHDLDLLNLVMFRHLPHLDEVSIGHALLSRALHVGLPSVVNEYLALLSAVD